MSRSYGLESYNMDSKYARLIRLGKVLHLGGDFAKELPDVTLGSIDKLAKDFAGTSIDEFLQVFTLEKRFKEDDMWNYFSAKEEIYKGGDTFTRDSFIEMLMIDAFQNPLMRNLGLGFMMATSALNEQVTGMSVFEQFMYEQRLEKEKHRVSVKNRTHLKVVKGGKN
jgi:hypothetical protein